MCERAEGNARGCDFIMRGAINASVCRREGYGGRMRLGGDAYTPGLTWATVSIHSTSWLVRGAEQ